MSRNRAKLLLRTICPGARDKDTRSNDLASMITGLGTIDNFRGNSIIPRLLAAVKVNLHSFVVPLAGFGYDQRLCYGISWYCHVYTDAFNRMTSFTTLCRCSKLQYLDCNLFSGGPIDISTFLNTISELREFESLRLPLLMRRTPPGASVGEWPPRLRQLSVGIHGCWDIELRPTLTEITSHADGRVFETILCSQQTRRTSLKSLHILSCFPTHYRPTGIGVLYRLITSPSFGQHST